MVIRFYTSQPTRSSSEEKITLLPITQKIVNKVAALAETKGMPSGLKIVSKTDTIIYNLAWIAGVDIPDNNNDDNAAKIHDDNTAAKIHDDEMHPDNIAGLALTRQQDNTQVDNEIELLMVNKTKQTTTKKSILMVNKTKQTTTKKSKLFLNWMKKQLKTKKIQKRMMNQIIQNLTG